MGAESGTSCAMQKQTQTSSLAILIAAANVRQEMGVTETTFWRWRRRGWLKTTNIAGRCYIDAEDLEDFRRRAKAGEFALPTQRPGKKGRGA